MCSKCDRYDVSLVVVGVIMNAITLKRDSHREIAYLSLARLLTQEQPALQVQLYTQHVTAFSLMGTITMSHFSFINSNLTYLREVSIDGVGGPSSLTLFITLHEATSPWHA